MVRKTYGAPNSTGAALALAASALMAIVLPVFADTTQSAVDNTKEEHLPVQILSIDKSVVLRNPGKDSVQILWPENAPDAQTTITKVTMQPGAVSERHSHARSEQTWLVEQGEGTLLLADDQTAQVRAGELVRTPPGVVHGIKNTGKDILVYLAITTPPENMSGFYKERSK